MFTQDSPTSTKRPRFEIIEQLKRFIKSDKMNGSDLKLVIQRRLFNSDVKPEQNRLNIQIKQLKTQKFLKVDEKRMVA